MVEIETDCTVVKGGIDNYFVCLELSSGCKVACKVILIDFLLQFQTYMIRQN
ncbi:hypothetical protein Mapa_008553 [Marchantia paleacea]|nr:hypothetical protein Mapa_008553 [Marchantia paleacea]